MRYLIVLLSTVLLWSERAAACPVCSSDTGIQVRSGIFNDEFIPTALAVLAPFPVLIAVVLLLHFGLPWRKRESRGMAASAKHAGERSADLITN